jgi:peptide-methionine (S)-S-oxide reductase
MQFLETIRMFLWLCRVYQKGFIMLKFIALFSIFSFVVLGCNLTSKQKVFKSSDKDISQMMDTSKLETATLGAGCFWCVEAIFQDVKGVERVESGYSGGSVKNPTYEDVCSGKTGHAEVAQITFDPSVVTYGQLLTVFFHVHDPTTMNRQGADVGTQYRSAISTTAMSKKTAEKVKRRNK